MLGHVVLWLLAIVGGLTVLAFAGLALSTWVFPEEESKEVKLATTPPAQIVNLRNIPGPYDEQPARPQVLQKTTMSITTTKYVDPNAKPPKEITS